MNDGFVCAFETSCDDTSVCILDSSGKVLFLESQDQNEFHKDFGGIVPEIASRNHSANLYPILDRAIKKTALNLDQIDTFIATTRPGLMGSLMVGATAAKTLAWSLKKKWVAVNHIKGHLFAPWVDRNLFESVTDFPHVSLVVSGGHTHIFYLESILSTPILIGQTKDDAAGEALDKLGKLLGLGFPGGAAIDVLSKSGNDLAFDFPKSLWNEGLMMSFSGLKSSVRRLVESMADDELAVKKADICASFQKRVVDILLWKLKKACLLYKPQSFSVSGGVSANSLLREKAENLSKELELSVFIPSMKYCTDNAAMIGLAGLREIKMGHSFGWNEKASPISFDQDFIKKLVLND